MKKLVITVIRNITGSINGANGAKIFYPSAKGAFQTSSRGKGLNGWDDFVDSCDYLSLDASRVIKKKITLWKHFQRVISLIIF